MTQTTFRVLVVDDDAAVRATYRHILQPPPSGLGELEALIAGTPVPAAAPLFQISEADQGEAAVHQFQTALEHGERFQLAFIDMRMPPGWDGMRTAVALRALDPSIYLVIATAFSDYDVHELQRALGHDVVLLRKPFNQEEVFQLARTLCQSWEIRQRLEVVTSEMERRVMTHTTELDRHNVRQTVLVEIATRFIEAGAEEDIDDAVNWSLARLGRALDVDVCTLFRLDTALDRYSLSHEWHALGVKPVPEPLRHLDRTVIAPAHARFLRGEGFHFNHPAELPGEMAALREHMDGHYQSILTVPLEAAGRLLGFLGIGLTHAGVAWDAGLEKLLLAVGHNITRALEAHEVSQALRESQARFHALVQNIPGMVYRCALDPNWTIQFMSDYIETLSGYPLSEFIDNRVRSYASIIHPEDLERVDQEVRSAVAAHAPFMLDYRIVHADGRPRWVHERGQATFDGVGQVAWLDGVISDANARKRMELALIATAEFVSAPAGEQFCADLVRHAAHTLGLDYVHTARLLPGTQRVETLAVWRDGQAAANWAYDLADTPCGEVIAMQRRCIESGVQGQYPHDQDLQAIGAEGYVGEPIVAIGGQVLGLIVGITRAALTEGDMVQANLRILAARTAAEWAQREALRDLRRERDTTRNILQTAETLIVALDLEGRITLINRKGCEVLGYSEAELLGRDWFTTCLPESVAVESIRAVFHQALAEDLAGAEYHENPVRTRSGKERLIAWHNSTIHDPQGRVIGAMSAGMDVTEQRRAEQALHVALTKYKTLFDRFPMGITVTDPAGQILETNAAAEQLLGVPACEHVRRGIGGTEWRIMRPDGSPMPAEEFASVRALKEKQRVEAVEMGIVKADGGTTWLSVTADLLPLEGYGVVITYSDITARREAEERVRKLAYFDSLTGLPNRRLLMDRLEHALLASKRSREYGALLMLDLDYFKVLNDSLGHDVGDQLLIGAAQRLSAQVREQDTVARLGGDEYLVILEDLGLDEGTATHEAEQIAEKIRLALDRPYTLTAGEAPYRCSASLGVALFHNHAEPIETLLKQADIALYQAKDAGRNTVCFFHRQPA